MANTDASKASAERLEGSNPSPRTIAQNIMDWNRSIFEDARIKREREWDAQVELHRRKHAKPQPPLPTLW
jgi:hypothetical protein